MLANSELSCKSFFVSLAGCPVFELRSEGSETSCAKHSCAKLVPRVLRERSGHTLPGCIEGEHISHHHCNRFLKGALYSRETSS